MDSISMNRKLESATNKIENYILSNDITLGVLFQVFDTDSSRAIDFKEFKLKSRAMKIEFD